MPVETEFQFFINLKESHGARNDYCNGKPNISTNPFKERIQFMK